MCFICVLYVSGAFCVALSLIKCELCVCLCMFPILFLHTSNVVCDSVCVLFFSFLFCTNSRSLFVALYAYMRSANKCAKTNCECDRSKIMCTQWKTETEAETDVQAERYGLGVLSFTTTNFVRESCSRSSKECVVVSRALMRFRSNSTENNTQKYLNLSIMDENNIIVVRGIKIK